MISFWFRETFLSIKKAQASFILSIISTTISVSLIIISLFLFILTTLYDQKIRESFSISLFLNDDVDKKAIQNLEKELQDKNFIRIINFISKEEAAENFIAETGEDFYKILDYNPLPASFEIYLGEEYVRQDSIINIKNELSSLAGVEEIGYSDDVYYKLLDYLNQIKKYISGGTILLIFISLYLIYSTNKLILNQRYDELNTMKLIGSKLVNIKMPVILNSVIIGIISAVISAAILYTSAGFIKENFSLPSDLIPGLILLGLVIGPVMGILVSIISLRKVSLKI
jgi:cell division transport system permease protein